MSGLLTASIAGLAVVRLYVCPPAAIVTAKSGGIAIRRVCLFVDWFVRSLLCSLRRDRNYNKTYDKT